MCCAVKLGMELGKGMNLAFRTILLVPECCMYEGEFIFSNCPTFRDTFSPDFWSQICCCPAFCSFCPAFFYWFLGGNLLLNLTMFSYLCQICKHILFLDQKSPFFWKFIRFLLQAGGTCRYDSYSLVPRLGSTWKYISCTTYNYINPKIIAYKAPQH